MLRFLLLLAGLIIIIPLKAQERIQSDRSLYVVIGAFANRDNAVKFVAEAKKQKLDAKFSMRKEDTRSLYYVYTLHTDDRLAAIDQAIKFQKGTRYPDAWVYTGLVGENAQKLTVNERDLNDINERQLEGNAANEVVGRTRTFYFAVTAISDGDTLPADIGVLDADAKKLTKVSSYRANDQVQVKSINASGNMMLVCELFGYRKIQHLVNFSYPDSTAGVTITDDVVRVPFEMVRLQKGDVATMYNLYFYNDAAIMRSESLSEVNSLVEMMQENKKYKIRIHGHTNGNGGGKIIYKGESKSFFSLNKNNEETRGSAKKLSEARAELIKEYLIENGVDASRMLIKAWGGDKPIYDTDHVSARINIRVEIEILEN